MEVDEHVMGKGIVRDDDDRCHHGCSRCCKERRREACGLVARQRLQQAGLARRHCNHTRCSPEPLELETDEITVCELQLREPSIVLSPAAMASQVNDVDALHRFDRVVDCGFAKDAWSHGCPDFGERVDLGCAR